MRAAGRPNRVGTTASCALRKRHIMSVRSRGWSGCGTQTKRTAPRRASVSSQRANLFSRLVALGTCLYVNSGVPSPTKRGVNRPHVLSRHRAHSDSNHEIWIAQAVRDCVEKPLRESERSTPADPRGLFASHRARSIRSASASSPRASAARSRRERIGYAGSSCRNTPLSTPVSSFAEAM